MQSRDNDEARAYTGAGNASRSLKNPSDRERWFYSPVPLDDDDAAHMYANNIVRKAGHRRHAGAGRINRRTVVILTLSALFMYRIHIDCRKRCFLDSRVLFDVTGRCETRSSYA